MPLLEFFSKKTSYRLAHCGKFPYYKVDGCSLNTKDIIYLVSVGKEKFEGIWVKRFVNFINEVKPQNTFIIVADSLQRFNIEIDENLSKEDSYQEAILRGKIWVDKYRSYFSKLNCPYKFIHWEDLKKDKDYITFLNIVNVMSESNDFFKEVLLKSSMEYIKRPLRLQQDQALLIKGSSEFLKEEFAVLRILAKESNTKTILYPSKATEVLDYAIQQINSLDRPDNPIRWIELKPKKEKNIKSEIKNEQTSEFQLSILPFFMSSTLSLCYNDEHNPLNVNPLKP
jgi:hypothetical protein